MAAATKLSESRPQDWLQAVFAILTELDVRQVAIVPDAGHSRLIWLCEADPKKRVVTLTTEEEGVALLAGAWLGGEHGVLLIQSSGVGNCINMLSLDADLPLAAPDAGDDARRLGRVQSVAGADGARHGSPHWRRWASSCVAPMSRISSRRQSLGAANLAFNTSRAVAVLIGQSVLGAKNFK